MEIEKKIWPEYFQKILEGKKKFELRLNDFECNEGDVLILKEWDPKTKEFTGRTIKRKVVGNEKFKLDELNQFWSQEEIKNKGLQIISLGDENGK